MKLRGGLVLAMIAVAVMGTGCSRTNMAVIASSGGANGEGNVVEIAATDGVAYQTLEATAPAGQPFTIRFTNPGAIGHNVVVVAPDQIEAVAAAADTTGNVPEDTEGAFAVGQVIVSTSEDIQIEEGLEAGEYVYICTVPGHTTNMQGQLIVE